MKIIVFLFFLLFGWKGRGEEKDLCKFCLEKVKTIQKYLQEEKICRDYIFPVAKELCILYPNKEACKSVFSLHGALMYWNMIGKYLNPNRICSLMKMCPSSHWTKSSIKEYIREILADKPKTQSENPKGHETYIITHITDIHADFGYELGANAKCGLEVCCQKESGKPKKQDDAAKYWGTNEKCDIPLRTVEAGLKFISKEIKPGIILWGGDNNGHDIWNNNRTMQTKPTHEITKLFEK